MDRFAYMLTHVVADIVGALGWGGRGRARMRQRSQGRDAANFYASTSIMELLRADVRPPALQLIGRRVGNPDSSGLLLAAALHRPGPRQQFVELFHRPAIDEFGENVGQVSLRVEAIEFCRLNQRSHAGPTKCPLIVTREKAVFFVSAIRRFARSTLFVSISMRPSSRKRTRPRQRLSP